MNLFTDYFNKLVKKDTHTNTQTHQNIALLLALAAKLRREDEDYNKVLATIVQTTMQMGLPAEAYNAAMLMPQEERERYKVNTIVDYLENYPCQGLTATIEISTVCNLRCPLCFHGGDRPYDNLGKLMPLKTFKHIWDKIAPHTQMAIMVGQGETFLHPQIYEMLDYMGDANIYVDTNGNVSLKPERILNRVRTLVFSIDGVDQRTYEKYRVRGKFDLAMRNLKAMVAAKRAAKAEYPQIIFKYVLFKHNEMYLETAEKLAGDIGVDGFRVEPCVATSGDSTEQIKKFMPRGHNATQRICHIDFDQRATVADESRDSPYCLHQMTNYSVLVDGSVAGCCASILESTFGNLSERNLEEIWHSPAYREFRKSALVNRFELPACANCTMNRNNLGPIFDGTALRYPQRATPSQNILRVADLRIDEEYAQELREQGLENELEYFITSGKYAQPHEAAS